VLFNSTTIEQCEHDGLHSGIVNSPPNHRTNGAPSLRLMVSELRDVLVRESIHIALIQEAHVPLRWRWLEDYGMMKEPTANNRNTIILVNR